MTSLTQAQRRRHERFAAAVPCRIVIPGGGSARTAPRFEAFVQTRDLSFGGAFLQSAFQFKNEPAVVVELRLPDELVTLKGRVVRKVDGGMGIAFDEMTAKAREAVLRHFVPADHRAFHKAHAVEVPVEKLSLILHQWDEWRAR